MERFISLIMLNMRKHATKALGAIKAKGMHSGARL